MAAGGLFSTPRPEPGHLLPALGGAVLILAALPIFLLLGWPVSGWALAATLWVFVHGLDYVLARVRRPSAVQAFGVFFKAIVLLAVLVATAASHPHVAVAAVVTYALAYTFELGLSLTTYFGGEPR